MLFVIDELGVWRYRLVPAVSSKYDNFNHHHHHHPQISSRRKSWTKLQGRYVSRITLQL